MYLQLGSANYGTLLCRLCLSRVPQSEFHALEIVVEDTTTANSIRWLIAYVQGRRRAEACGISLLQSSLRSQYQANYRMRDAR